MPSGQRDPTVGADPVAGSQLADQTHRVTRSWTLALRSDHVAAGFDGPAAGVERRQCEALVPGGQVEWIWTATARFTLPVSERRGGAGPTR